MFSVKTHSKNCDASVYFLIFLAHLYILVFPIEKPTFVLSTIQRASNINKEYRKQVSTRIFWKHERLFWKKDWTLAFLKIYLCSGVQDFLSTHFALYERRDFSSVETEENCENLK